MKQITIFTSKPITSGLLSDRIKETFPKKQIVSDDETQLFIGKFPTELIIMYSPNDRIGNFEYDFSETFRQQIPLDNPYCMDIRYHSFTIVRQTVKVLLETFPELYVYDDDYQWLGSGIDFVTSQHQTKESGYIGPNYKE